MPLICDRPVALEIWSSGTRSEMVARKAGLTKAENTELIAAPRQMFSREGWLVCKLKYIQRTPRPDRPSPRAIRRRRS